MPAAFPHEPRTLDLPSNVNDPFPLDAVPVSAKDRHSIPPQPRPAGVDERLSRGESDPGFESEAFDEFAHVVSARILGKVAIDEPCRLLHGDLPDLGDPGPFQFVQRPQDRLPNEGTPGPQAEQVPAALQSSELRRGEAGRNRRGFFASPRTRAGRRHGYVYVLYGYKRILSTCSLLVGTVPFRRSPSPWTVHGERPRHSAVQAWGDGPHEQIATHSPPSGDVRTTSGIVHVFGCVYENGPTSPVA